MEYVKGKKYRIKSVAKASGAYSTRDQWIGREVAYSHSYGRCIFLKTEDCQLPRGYIMTLEEISPVVGKRYVITDLGEDDAYYGLRDQIIGSEVTAVRDFGGGWYLRFDHLPDCLARESEDEMEVDFLNSISLQEITTPPTDPLQEAWESYDDQQEWQETNVEESKASFQAGWQAALEWRNKQ